MIELGRWMRWHAIQRSPMSRSPAREGCGRTRRRNDGVPVAYAVAHAANSA